MFKGKLEGTHMDSSEGKQKMPSFQNFVSKTKVEANLLTTRLTSLDVKKKKSKNTRILIYENELKLSEQPNVYLVSVGKKNFHKVPANSSMMLMANTFQQTVVIVAGTLQLYNLMADKGITFGEAYIKSKILEELWVEENLPVASKFKNVWIVRWDDITRTRDFVREMELYVKQVRKYAENAVFEKKYKTLESAVRNLKIADVPKIEFEKIIQLQDNSNIYLQEYNVGMNEILQHKTFYDTDAVTCVESSNKEFCKRKKKQMSSLEAFSKIEKRLIQYSTIYLRQELVALTNFFIKGKYKFKNQHTSITLEGSKITNISYPGKANDILQAMIAVTNKIRHDEGMKLNWREIRFKRIKISIFEYLHKQYSDESGFYEQFLDTAFFELFPPEALKNLPDMLKLYIVLKLTESVTKLPSYFSHKKKVDIESKSTQNLSKKPEENSNVFPTNFKK